MCLRFIKKSTVQVCLAAAVMAAFCLPMALIAAESGVVTVTGVGKDAQEALPAMLRQVVIKNFKSFEHMPACLQKEIVPNASSYVQSYRIQERSSRGAVFSAEVDLEVIRALLSFVPKTLGEEQGAKVLLAAKGVVLPNIDKNKASVGDSKPFAVLSEAARDWLQRRGFEVMALDEQEARGLGMDDDMYSPEVLRALGLKHSARVVLSISPRFEAVENENSHSKEERVMVGATLHDVKLGVQISRSAANFPSPKTRNETFVSDLQKMLTEESKDLFQDLFVGAGKKYLQREGSADFSIIRVLNPSRPLLVSQFRTLLEATKGMNGVVEYKVKRGAFDLAVRPARDAKTLLKTLQGLQSEEIVIVPVSGPESTDPEFTVAVKLEAKPKPEAPEAAGESGEADNARKN